MSRIRTKCNGTLLKNKLTAASGPSFAPDAAAEKEAKVREVRRNGEKIVGGPASHEYIVMRRIRTKCNGNTRDHTRRTLGV